MLYLLCFDRRFKHAKHYLGFVDGDEQDVQERIARHLSGHGGRLMKVITEAGITARLAWTMPGTRSDERYFKGRGKSCICPLCGGTKPKCRSAGALSVSTR